MSSRCRPSACRSRAILQVPPKSSTGLEQRPGYESLSCSAPEIQRAEVSIKKTNVGRQNGPALTRPLQKKIADQLAKNIGSPWTHDALRMCRLGLALPHTQLHSPQLPATICFPHAESSWLVRSCWLALFALAAPHADAQSSGPRVRWFVAHQTVSEQGASLAIGRDSLRVSLRGGWSCLVSPVLGWGEARDTSCQKDAEVIEFSVSCSDANRSNDHTQLRFRDARRRPIDYIEVLCKRES
jgi:hypothetical protein